MTATAVRSAAAAISLSRPRRRIVILTEDSKPALGGIAEYLHQLALATSVSHDVLVVTSVVGAEGLNSGLPFEYRQLPWFRTQWRFRGDDFVPIRRWNSLVWRLRRGGVVRDLLRSIHAERPDSSYVLGRLSPVTHPWCRACRDLGLPYHVIAHGLELIEPVGVVSGARRADDIAGAAFWFANSHDTAQRLAGLGVREECVTVLRPGVARPEAPLSHVDREAVRARFGLGSRRFLLSVCHLRARKGVDLAIRALAALGPEAGGLTYVVVGSGPEGDGLRRLARDLGVADRVVFVGAVTDCEKAALLAECEFFVLPTRALAGDVEGFGIVFLEAGWYGKAVIGGRNGGVPEAVVDGVTGLLVDTGDAGPLTAAIRHLLAEPAQTAAMGRRGRERARREFDWRERGVSFAGQLDALAVTPPAAQAIHHRGPLHQFRRYAGTTSNRVLSTAYVFGELGRAGRLPVYAARREPPADRADCARATLGWVRSAFRAGDEGGAAAGYHLAHGWAGAYPEITGYLIPTLLTYADRGAGDLADLAVRAGDWLARTRLPGGAICRKQWFPGNTAPSVFNTAQVAEGWCALAATSTDRGDAPGWLALAREAGDWLVSEQEPDGSWVRNAFNGIPHSYYARVAAPLARIGRATGEARYATAARAAAEWVVGRQSASGWFADAGFTQTEAPTTHTIGYVIEGLATCGLLLDEPRYVEAAHRAAHALLTVYEERGRLPGRFGDGWRPRARWRCLTGDAQIAVTWCLLAAQSGERRYLRAAGAMADSIRQTVRIIPQWPEISGAIQGSYPAWGEYDQYSYPTHAAKFTLDLFSLLDQ